MKLYWTKSKNIVDWIIWLLCGQDCAHFAFSFMVNGQELVFEANLLGCHTVFYSTWIAQNSRKIIHGKTVPVSNSEIAFLFKTWVEKYDGKMYDFLGAIYTGLMTLRLRLFKIPKPKRNAWGSRTEFYCDEIYQLVSGKYGFPKISEMSNGMDTPHDMWDKVK